MNIGIDIDDTISNSFESIFTSAQKFDIELGNSGTPKQYGKIPNHSYIETMYSHWTKEQIHSFWERYFIDMLTIATPKDYVAEILQQLKEEENNLILITSRCEYLPNSNIVENYTKQWLSKNNIHYDKLIMNSQNKLIAAKENNIDLFIDDSIEHCKNLRSGGIKTFLYTSICNQAIEEPELERVYSWVQIYDKATTLNKSLCKVS